MNQKQSEHEENIMIFRIKNRNIAFRIHEIQSIIPAISPIIIPKTIPCIHGMLPYHGTWLFIFHIEKLLNNEKPEIEKISQLIAIVQIESWFFGFGIEEMPKIEKPPLKKRENFLLIDKETLHKKFLSNHDE